MGSTYEVFEKTEWASLLLMGIIAVAAVFWVLREIQIRRETAREDAHETETDDQPPPNA